MLSGGDSFIRDLLREAGVSLHPAKIYPHLMNILVHYIRGIFVISLSLSPLWITSYVIIILKHVSIVFSNAPGAVE